VNHHLIYIAKMSKDVVIHTQLTRRGQDMMSILARVRRMKFQLVKENSRCYGVLAVDASASCG